MGPVRYQWWRRMHWRVFKTATSLYFRTFSWRFRSFLAAALGRGASNQARA